MLHDGMRLFIIITAICFFAMLWMASRSLVFVDYSNSCRFWTIKSLNNNTFTLSRERIAMESHEWAIQFNVLLKSVNIVSNI